MTKSIHALRRTSPKGEAFIGTCTKCGKPGLRGAQLWEECANIRGVTNEQAAIELIRGEGP